MMFGGCRVGVTSEPEVVTHTLGPDDAFIILASDGVWEFIESQEAADIVGSAANAQDGCRQVRPTMARRHIDGLVEACLHNDILACWNRAVGGRGVPAVAGRGRRRR